MKKIEKLETLEDNFIKRNPDRPEVTGVKIVDKINEIIEALNSQCQHEEWEDDHRPDFLPTDYHYGEEKVKTGYEYCSECKILRKK